MLKYFLLLLKNIDLIINQGTLLKQQEVSFANIIDVINNVNDTTNGLVNEKFELLLERFHEMSENFPYDNVTLI